jgi:hypothetical protein
MKETTKSVFKKPEVIFPIILLIFFIFMLIQVPSLMLGILLTSLHIYREVRGKIDFEEIKKLQPLNKRFWGILVLTVIYMVAITYGGFYIPSLVFIPVCMWVMGVRSYRTMTLTTVGTLIIVYLVFGYFLYVPMLTKIFG